MASFAYKDYLNWWYQYADSNKTSGGSQFRVTAMLNVKEFEDGRMKAYVKATLAVLSNNFEGANCSYALTVNGATKKSGSERIYAAGDMHTFADNLDLGWFGSGTEISISLRCWYTGGSGTTYQAKASFSKVAKGYDCFMPPAFTAAIGSASITDNVEMKPGGGSVLVTVPLCTAAQWTTPVAQLGQTFRPTSLIIDCLGNSLARSDTAAATLNLDPKKKLAELYAANGGYEGYRDAINKAFPSTQFVHDVPKGTMALALRQYFSYGNDEVGYLSRSRTYYVLLNVLTGSIVAYSAGGIAKEATVYAFDSGGRLCECEVYAYDSGGLPVQVQ